MLEYVLAFIAGTVISWIALMIVIPIAQKIAEFSMPHWPETAWKLAVIAAAGNIVAMLLNPLNVWISLIVGAIVFWTLMVRWFDVDFFAAVIIVIVSWIVRALLMTYVMLALASL